MGARTRSEEPAASKAETLTGAEIVVRALKDQGVDVLFGYPGGAVLPIYDALYSAEGLRHILVRHEQGAGHAAEGYARSTGRPGVVLVTSGPGATNVVTPLADALLDSIPLVVLTGQVATHLIGSDAFQECDTVGVTRACTKHNWLVRDVNDLARVLHEAFYVATSGRPGPVVVDIPKDVQFAAGVYVGPGEARLHARRPVRAPDEAKIAAALDLMASAKRPLFYTGGGVINAGPAACAALRALVKETGFPITSTLLGLGAFPAADAHWLGMVGMHGSWQSNHAMHDCDVMICVGARFDDRVTGRIDAFSPDSKKIHIDVDPSSINKNVLVDIGLIADAGAALEALLEGWRARFPPLRAQASGGGAPREARVEGASPSNVERAASPLSPRLRGDSSPARGGANLKSWWEQINIWRAKDCFAYKPDPKVIKPQFAIQRLYEAVKDRDVYITTEVGQHQMWAAQYFHFQEPNRWMTSGGLGTMGYGLPAAVGVQAAHPGALVIDIAGEASVQMTMQEMSTAVQHDLPIKVFILNNEWMGMVRQWQQLLHGERYSHSYSEALPDFVKLAEAYGAVGIRAERPDELDDAIAEMIAVDKPVIFDCRVTKDENCFPMIPSGKAHNEMILAENFTGDEVNEEGKILV